MTSPAERRKEERIRYSWPFWFSYEDNGAMHKAKMIDLTSQGACFTLPAHSCPRVGQHIQSRFSYPLDDSGLFLMQEYCHWSEVIRVDTDLFGATRVAVRLHQPLHQGKSQPQEALDEVLTA